MRTMLGPATRGDLESPSRWTVKSLRRLSQELSQMVYEVSRSRGEPGVANVGLQLTGQ